MTAEPRYWGGVSHPLQLTTGLVIKSITTSPTFGRWAYAFYSAGKYSVGTNDEYERVCLGLPVKGGGVTGGPVKQVMSVKEGKEIFSFWLVCFQVA